MNQCMADGFFSRRQIRNTSTIAFVAKGRDSLPLFFNKLFFLAYLIKYYITII